MRLTQRLLDLLQRRAAAAAGERNTAAAAAVSLWEIAIDPREGRGFTGSCMRLFCLTSLLRDGKIRLSTDEHGILNVEAGLGFRV